ncbi:permease [Candidatus Bipolaricaulota bacterium]|nr:permease [Candidatus Bipolaricaulota bacterium]
MSRNLKIFAWIAGTFLFAYFVPFSHPKVQRALAEAFLMLQDYARQHVLTCLVPAFFIAGAISVFISQAAVIRYLGYRAKKALAYGVASVSGTILAVCSCTVLPLFAGIYKRGAGLGPAIAFLYSGPAINILAIILTARVLGPSLGLARAIGAVLFSIVIGLSMHVIFRKEEKEKAEAALAMPEPERPKRPLWKTAVLFALMIAVLVFANWGRPSSVTLHLSDGTVVTGIRAGEEAESILVKLPDTGEMLHVAKDDIVSTEYPQSAYTTLWRYRYGVAGLFLLVLLSLLPFWMDREEGKAWMHSTWDYAVLILPYLFGGVLVAGFLLGRPGSEALIPARWVESAVGGNSWAACAIASVAGALMYFATLTEVPILQGLIGAGMGPGPALALLLAGPALSLPNMLVIRRILGTKKTLAYVTLVVIAATLTGKLYGTVVGP